MITVVAAPLVPTMPAPSGLPTAPAPGGVRTPGVPHPGRVLRAVAEVVGPFLPPLAVSVVLAALAAVGVVCWRGHTARRWAVGARMITVGVPPHVDPAGGRVLWANLVGVLARPRWRRWVEGQPWVSFEYAWTAAGLRVAVWVPAPIPPGVVEHALRGAWPGVTVDVTDPQPPLPVGVGPAPGVAVTGGELRLAEPDWFPLATRHEVDPLRALLAAADPAGLPAGQTAAVQVLARPALGRRAARALHAARALRTTGTAAGGGGLPGAGAGLVVTGLGRAVAATLDVFVPGPTRTATAPYGPRAVGAGDPVVTADVRAILDKATGPRWETVVRYAATATVEPGVTAEQARGRARGHADGIASAFAVHTGRNRLARHRLRHPAQVLAGRRLKRGDLLSVPELAAVAHLPADAAAPGVGQAGARPAAPPVGVPAGGVGTKPLGDTDAGPTRPVALRVADARHHLHVIGATGSGKTTLLARHVLSDAAAERGVAVIEPKGDLVTDLLDRLPADVADRLVIIDPDQPGARPSLNPLAVPPAARWTAVDNLLGIFRRVWADYWGPRTEDVLRAALLTLTHPAVTRGGEMVPSLADVPALLTDPGYREQVVSRVRDPLLAGFWGWYAQLGDGASAAVTGPVMNKLRAVLLRPFARDTLTSGDPVDLSAVLDGGVLLVRLPKGTLGEDTCRLLGSFVLAQLWQAATARAGMPEHVRRDASVVLDEAHNFLTMPGGITDMLAEARALRLGLTLAHQNLAQLPRDLREGLSTNARTKVFFTVSPEDAAVLERHVHPRLDAHDLTHLDGFQAACRPLVDGRPAPAFTLRTRPLPAPVPGRAAALRAAVAARSTAPVRDDPRTADPDLTATPEGAPPS